MENEIKVCQIMIYCLGLIIGFLTQLLYPWFFLTIGAIIAGFLIKYTITVMEHTKGDGRVYIKIK